MNEKKRKTPEEKYAKKRGKKECRKINEKLSKILKSSLTFEKFVLFFDLNFDSHLKFLVCF